MTPKDHRELTAADASEVLRHLETLLADSGADGVPITVGEPAHAVRLPRDIAMILREVLVNVAAGTPVSVLPTHAELTTQQAADLLNVSRPYLIKLLDEGELAYRKVGTHRRVRIEELEAYQRKQALTGKRAADELTELSQNLELY